MSGKATAAPVRERRYSPSEFSGALAGLHIGLCEKLVRQRCNLPESDPLHIATIKGFPGRHWIPESELFRIAGINVEVSA
jgi:hypothetical protein